MRSVGGCGALKASGPSAPQPRLFTSLNTNQRSLYHDNGGDIGRGRELTSDLVFSALAYVCVSCFIIPACVCPYFPLEYFRI